LKYTVFIFINALNKAHCSKVSFSCKIISRRSVGYANTLFFIYCICSM